MSSLKQHKRISKAAYKLIKPRIKNYCRPNYVLLRIFDTLLNPDIIQSFKFIKGYEKYNHLNTAEHNQGVEKCVKFYEKFQLNSKRKIRGSFTASWFAHFLVDTLEPAHHLDWKIPHELIPSLKNLYFHLWLEKNTKNLEIDEILDFDMKVDNDVRNYIEKNSLIIKDLDIKSLFPNEKEKILYLYREVIIPQQIRSVASFWYSAIRQSDNGVVLHAKNKAK